MTCICLLFIFACGNIVSLIMKVICVDLVGFELSSSEEVRRGGTTVIYLPLLGPYLMI